MYPWMKASRFEYKLGHFYDFLSWNNFKVAVLNEMCCFVLDLSVTALPGMKRSRFGKLLSKIGVFNSHDNVKSSTYIQVKEMNNHTTMDICSMNSYCEAHNCC